MRVSRRYSSLLEDVVIVSARRTAFTNFLGSLRKVPAPILASHAIQSSLISTSISPSQISEVILGHTLTTGVGQNPTRQAALLSNLPLSTICTGVNKGCASGIKAITLAAQGISLGESDIVIAGGMESTSLAPFILNNYRTGVQTGDGVILDTLMHEALLCPFNKTMMGSCAEKTAQVYKILRKDQDEYCKNSYRKAIAAWDRGFFKNEVEPIEVPAVGNEKVEIVEDSQCRKVVFDKVSEFRPLFDRNGTVTQANSAGHADGACVLIAMSSRRAKEIGVKPLARVRGYADSEIEPVHFGVAPKDAIMKALENARISKSKIGLYEINETYSSAVLAVVELLGLDIESVNVNGGAIAIGHPIAASGARIVATLIYALKEKNIPLGVAVASNGGGGATAIVLEAI